MRNRIAVGLLLIVLGGFSLPANAASWYRRYSAPAEPSMYVLRLAESPDGSLLLMYTPYVGRSSGFRLRATLNRWNFQNNDGCDGFQRIVLIKLAASGEVTWSSSFGRPTCIEGVALVATLDGGALVGAYEQSSENIGSLFRVSSQGELLWSHRYNLDPVTEGKYVAGMVRVAPDEYAVAFTNVLARIDGNGIPLASDAFQSTLQTDDGPVSSNSVFNGVAALPGGDYAGFNNGFFVIPGTGGFTMPGGGSLRVLNDGTFITWRDDHAVVSRIGPTGAVLWSVAPGTISSYPADIDANGDSWITGLYSGQGGVLLHIVRADGTEDALRLSLRSQPDAPLNAQGVLAGSQALWLVSDEGGRRLLGDPLRASSQRLPRPLACRAGRCLPVS